MLETKARPAVFTDVQVVLDLGPLAVRQLAIHVAMQPSFGFLAVNHFDSTLLHGLSLSVT